MSPTYEHPRPAVTVDLIPFLATSQGRLEVLLIRRRSAPFAGTWALPGGFLEMDEELGQGARRELCEETGIEVGPLLQVGAYGTLGRDPRGRTISAVYLALDAGARPAPRAGDDAAEVRWFLADELPALAFDHGDILRDARRRLGALGLGKDPVGLMRLLRAPFTIAELQAASEAVAGLSLARKNFRRRVLNLGVLEECGTGEGRDRRLYRLKEGAES